MAKPVQMPLDLGGGPSYAAADFLVADSNRDAHAAIDGWTGWRTQALALVGPEGSGKTHLAHLFAARSGVPIVGADHLRPDAVPGLAEAAAVAVEDVDRGVDEPALLHLFNLSHERGRRLLLTGREPPARWRIGLADLRSRLVAMSVAVIRPPDEALLAALMVKLFADRQLRIDPGLPAYLMPRLERSFGAIHAAVAALDRAAMELRRPVNAALARDVLGFGVTPDLWDG